jgi:hypothetical protein
MDIAMTDLQVNLTLTSDTPNSMIFLDTYAGLNDIWYQFSVDGYGNISLWANSDGFEHLARYFLKMARSSKNPGYHAHHKLEFGSDLENPELTIGFCNKASVDIIGERLPYTRLIAVPRIGVLTTRSPSAGIPDRSGRLVVSAFTPHGVGRTVAVDREAEVVSKGEAESSGKNVVVPADWR